MAAEQIVERLDRLHVQGEYVLLSEPHDSGVSSIVSVYEAIYLNVMVVERFS